MESSKNWMSRKYTPINTNPLEVEFKDQFTNEIFEPIRVKITAGSAAVTWDYQQAGEFNETVTASGTYTIEWNGRNKIFVKVATANNTVTITAW